MRPALNSSDAALRKEALWTQSQLLQREYLHAPPHSPDQRQAAYQALREHTRMLAQHNWPLERQMQLAALASQLGETDISLALSQEEAPSDPREAALFYERSAKEALGRGDYEGCAHLYLSARASTPAPDQAKAYYNAAVAALRSGNQPQAALALAERELGPLADDPQTLFMLTQLARAAGRPDIAEHYVRRLLHISLQRQASQWALAGEQDWTPQQVAWRQAPAAPAGNALFDDGASQLVHPALRGALQVADKKHTPPRTRRPC